MTTEYAAPVPVYQFLDNNGAVVPGGLLFTYAAGTNTKLASYTDSTGSTPNANPVVADANGRLNLWTPPNVAYKFVWCPSTDTDPPTNSFWTADQVISAGTISLPAGSITSTQLATSVLNLLNTRDLQFAIGDQVNTITADAVNEKFVTRLPACNIQSVKASLKTASSSGLPTFDITVSGSSIFSTLLTIDTNETTSKTAATPAVISSPVVLDDQEVKFFITGGGTGAVGPIITMRVLLT